MDIESLFGVRDKIVVVTGGSRGIGLMIAKGFVANGAKVYIVSRDQAACEQTATELAAKGPGQCYGMGVDMQKSEDITRFVSALEERESDGIDILINNAGANWGETVENYPISGFKKVMNLNLTSIFFLSQKLLPSLGKRATAEDPSRIINISSIAGLVLTRTNTIAYNASKAGLNHMSRGMAVALAPRNITVNTVAPGSFPSKMMAETLRRDGDKIVQRNPMRRIGVPRDMMGATIYLASQAGKYITGSVLVVDGGACL